MSTDHIMHLFCDGGVLGGSNPGIGTYWSVGKGVGEGRQETEIVERDESYDYTTNNESEYLALNAALLYAATQHEHGVRRVIIHSDSQLIVNQFSGDWKCGQPHLQKLLELVRRNARFLKMTGITVEVVWVKRSVNVRRLGH